MPHDFDRSIDRMNTQSVKWDGLQMRFGVNDALPMWVADMDFKAPPAVVEALTKRAEHGIYGYTLRGEEYHQSVIGWLERRHGFTVLAEWLQHSPGVVAGLSLIVHTFSMPGDKIIVQPPVYYPFSRVIAGLGRTIVENPLLFDGTRYEMDFEDLEAKAAAGAKMIILCSPHNPVGRVWTPDELQKLGEICLRHNVLVVSDEIHSDLLFLGVRHTPFASLSESFAQNSITCIAPSKTFNLAGLATSVIIIPNADLGARYAATMDQFHLNGANTFGATALQAAYTHGDAWVDDLRAYLQGNLDYMTQFMEERIPEIKVIKPEGTYLVWIDCRALGLDDKALDAFFLERAKMALDEGHIFGTGGSGFQRVNLACTRATLEKAMNSLQSAVREHMAART